MIFHKLRRRKATARKNMIILIIIIFFVNFIFPNFFPNFAFYLYSPVWYLSSIAENQTNYFVLKPNTEILKENFKLREKNDEITRELSALNDLKIENIKLAGFFDPIKKDGLIASILAKPNVSIYDTIIIDIGENKGVEVGDFIAIANNIVVGKIIETHKTFSKASLLSTPGTETLVTVGPKNIQTTAYGQGNGNLFIRLPKDSLVKDGDLIRIPELSNEIIGTVSLFQFDDSSAFSRIIFSLPTNIYEMRWIGIKKPLIRK